MLPASNAFRRDERHGRQPPTRELTRRLLYVRYKMCDRRIEDALQSMVPPDKYRAKKHGINGITEATDYIVQKKLKIDRRFFKDLKESIRDRRNMAVHEYGDGDEGHAHVIKVLEYCWTRLLPLRKTKVVVQTGPASHVDPSASNGEAGMSSFYNQFDRLLADHSQDDADSDTDDEIDLPKTPQPRPEEAVASVHASTYADRTDIISFVNTIEGLMGFTASRFKALVQMSARIQSDGLPSSSIVAHILEASVAANIAIQQVAALEEMFIEEHPHLNTAYRMFANLVLVDLVKVMAIIVAKKSPRASQFSDKVAIAFLGDTMEGVFREKYDPDDKTFLGDGVCRANGGPFATSQARVVRFISTWQLKDDEPVLLATGELVSVQSTFTLAQMRSFLEVAKPAEKDVQLMNIAEKLRLSSQTSTWLNMKHIGQNRSITTTFRHLQMIFGREVFDEGHFGVPWSERSEPATKIQGDMDELLLHDLMPALMNMAVSGPTDLKYQNQLLSGFVQIKSWKESPDHTVSWALAFTIHTVLTSILETQECQLTLAQAAQFSFLTYQQQFKSVEKRADTLPQQPPIYEITFGTLAHLWQIACAGIPQTREQILLSIWNPFCAGSLLSYIAYFGNLVTGMQLADAVGQLRMTLHLFNALQQIGSIRSGEIQVLDKLHRSFMCSTAIWNGALPVQGQFKSRWNTVGFMNRIVQPLADLSMSFRRICLLDFRGDMGKARHRQRAKKSDPRFKQTTSVHETLDAMLDDSELLGTNLFRLGFLFHDMWSSLFNELNLMPRVHMEVSKQMEADKKRKGSKTKIKPRLSGIKAAQLEWDFSEEGWTYSCILVMFGHVVMKGLDAGDVTIANAATKVLKRIFQETNPATYMWFTTSKQLSLL